MERITGLSKLELLWPEGFLDPPRPLMPLPFHLSSLSIWLESKPSPTFLKALFTCSKDTLVTLHFRSGHPDINLEAQEWLAPVLPFVSGRIRHLILEQSNEDAWRLLPDGLGSFTAVETLHLGVVGCVYSDWYLTEPHFIATIATLPPSVKLRRLSLGIRKPVHLGNVIPYLTHAKLANLKQVDMPLELKTDRGGEEFMKVCEHRNVKVAMRMDLGLAETPLLTLGW